MRGGCGARCREGALASLIPLSHSLPPLRLLSPAMAFEAIHRGRATLLAHLSVESELLLDEVAALGIITEEEYEALETCAEPREKVRRLLVKVQRKGEDSCQQFLDCLQSLFPDLPPDLWPPQPGKPRCPGQGRAGELVG